MSSTIIAERLRSLAAGEPPWPVIDVDRAIPWLEARGGVTLAASQREALRLALSSKALVITGGPGVGKTTLVNSILKALVAKSVSVALCAPTGRAAKRLTETTGVEAKTIHRPLETDPKNGGFKRDESHPLACDLLVVDETSMVDVLLMKALVRALPTRAALLLVGGVDQLPSVRPGQVLADVIGSGAVPVVRLIEVFRQAATNRVIVNAHRINRGEMPEIGVGHAERSDFYVMEAADPEQAVAKIVAMVRDRVPKAFGLDVMSPAYLAQLPPTSQPAPKLTVPSRGDLVRKGDRRRVVGLFEFMSADQALFPVSVMARVLDVSKAGFYAWRGRPASAHSTADEMRCSDACEPFMTPRTAPMGCPALMPSCSSKANGMAASASPD